MAVWLTWTNLSRANCPCDVYLLDTELVKVTTPSDDPPLLLGAVESVEERCQQKDYDDPADASDHPLG